MVVLDDLKNLVLYKKDFFLPIDEDDKKRNSAIMLLTPNYQSSINAMKVPYTINRRYFESYYMEKNVTRYTNGKSVIDEQYLININEADLSSEDRKNLPDSSFGLPKQRRYPMPDKQHVLMAIRFFNHVEKEYEEELAKNIIKKIKEFQMESEVHVTEKNRFYSYWRKVFTEGVMLESSNRQKIIDDANKSLESIGLKAHISKNGEWGSDKFLDGAESLCLGSFKKEDYNKAYNQLKSDLKGKCKVIEDNYFTIFIHLSESAILEDDDDLDFSYYFSDDIKEKFNNSVDMSEVGDEPIDEVKSINEAVITEGVTPTNIESCTGVILDNKARILVEYHKRTNTLTLPGGKMDINESETQALVRELREEIGIDVKEAKILYDFTFNFNYLDDNKDYICTDHLYMITRYEGQIRNMEENKHKFVRFMSVNEIMMHHAEKSEILKRFIAQYGYKYSTDPSAYMSKFISTSNVVYTGYDSDTRIARGFINQELLKKIFEKCSINYPKSTITVIVSGAKSEYGYIDENNITILSKAVFEKEYKDYAYMDYIKFMSTIYAYHTVNPNVMDTIVYPLAMYKSGSIDEFLAQPKNKMDAKYEMERVFKYIYEIYGDRPILQIVRNNDIRMVFQYAKEMTLNPKSSVMKELAMLCEEDQPATLDDVQNIGQKITRKIKAASVYKLNKISRDIERGNTGTETRTITSLEKLKSGELGKAPIPDVGSVSSDTELTNEISILIGQREGFDYITDGTVDYFLEDGINYNHALRDALYASRLKNSKEVLEVYRKVKADCPFIKFAFPSIERYGNKNLFFDLSFYNESFFKNSVNTDERTKISTQKIYRELLKRLINDSRFKSYNKKTIFLPVLDWRHNNSTRMWIYREDLNPISIIYDMIKNNPKDIIDLFGDMDVIFMGVGNYFKVNFSQVDITKDRVEMKLIQLIKRMIVLGQTHQVDPDPEDEPENSAKGIAMDLVDKVEKSQNIEIKSVKPILKMKQKTQFADKEKQEELNVAVKKVESDKTEDTPKITAKTATIKTTKDDIIKATKVDTTKDTQVVNVPDKEKQKDELVGMIAKAAEDASSIDDAVDNLDDDKFKELLALLASQEEENIRVSKARAVRIVELSNNFQKKEVAGKSVKDLLSENPNDANLPKTKLPVASSEKCWDDMTFMNFDKTYDPDSDIVKMLDNMKNWSYPIAVRDIKVTDNSTSEDYVNLWDIDCEDFKGTRFKLKVDIPKFINDKFLKLRGNEKSLMLQSTLMPIVKTDLDTCQIIGVGGYNKIFVRRYGSGSGKSMPSVDKLIKTLNRYDKGGLDITFGDNTKICNKYELPIDYIDLASYYDKIKTNNLVLYFNQDELRKDYVIDDSKGLALGVYSGGDKKESIIYYGMEQAKTFKLVSGYIANLVMGDVNEIPDIVETYNSIIATGKRYMYSRASILNIKIPLVIVCAYVEGLVTTLKKANIDYSFKQKLDRNDKYGDSIDYIQFSDGYLLYENTYISTMLMNGLKSCNTESYSIKDINSKEMYMDFLTDFGGSLKSDGLDNSYDCMLDPITKEILSIYKLPTDYVSVLLYANALLADNKFVKHTDYSVRRLRRKELLAGYFYKALTTSYQSYASQIRHTRKNTKMSMKQSAVIDMLLSKDPSMNDLSVNNAINDVESANTITSKGLVGMNSDRAYSLDKRGYDPTMLNVVGMSTGFSGNVGINRQATVNCNVVGARGFIAPIDGNTEKFSTANTLTITEALTPFGSTHDDPFRTLMTYIQTSKHLVRTEYSDPLLVTNGSDEAMPYLVSDIFAFKAKQDGKVVEIHLDPNGRDSYMVLEYKDGSHDFVDLSEEIKKNSDGGYHVPMKLTTDLQVGNRVKTGEVIAYDKSSFSNSIGESGNLALNVGTLAKVAIMNTDEGFEDSAACTEAFARRLGTEVIVKHTKVIDKNANVFLMKKIGERVMEGETILSYQTSFDDDIANSLLRNLSMSEDEISELGRNPIKSHYTGILQDIKIYRTVEMDELSPSLQKLVKAYESPIKKRKAVYNQYGIDSATLPSTQKVGNVGKTKNVYDGLLIEFYIKYIDNMAIGDKVVFYSANKGVIKYIIPEGQEPYTDFRNQEAIDAFVSIGSINGRMVCSTQIYGSLAKLEVELDRSCKDIAGIPYDVTRA